MQPWSCFSRNCGGHAPLTGFIGVFLGAVGLIAIRHQIMTLNVVLFSLQEVAHHYLIDVPVLWPHVLCFDGRFPSQVLFVSLAILFESGIHVASDAVSVLGELHIAILVRVLVEEQILLLPP